MVPLTTDLGMASEETVHQHSHKGSSLPHDWLCYIPIPTERPIDHVTER